MTIKKAIPPFLAAAFVISGMFGSTALYAGDDGRGERHERNERHERGERRDGKFFAPVSNPAYKQECSSCHFLYLPGLLPARSWHELMKKTDKHFGENLSMDEKTRDEITAYLAANAAEKDGGERARKMLSSIGDSTPVRITEVPYIIKEHRKIKPDVFKRPSIGSFSNCGGCHTKGAEGNFEEDAVVIPKK